MKKEKILKMDGVESIKKISLKQGDVLLVEFPRDTMNEEAMLGIVDRLLDAFGKDAKIVFYIGALKFGVIEMEDIISGGDIHAELPDLK